jgi:ABC transporter substrate binding protein
VLAPTIDSLYRPGMDRRRFLLTSLIGGLVAPRVTHAQPPTKIARIGVLATEFPDALRKSLRDLGYIEGRNVVFEVRETRGRADRVDDLAVELARLKVDVLVGTNPAAVFSARRATTKILSIKQIQLLREAVPGASRIAMLWNPDSPWHPLVAKGLRDEKQGLGVPLQMLPIRGPEEFDAAFQTLVRERVGAALALADPATFAHRRRLADLATRFRIPVMGGLRAYTEAGCLMSYWADENELYRRAATYVHRILKRGEPSGASHRAAHQVRTCDQPQDCQGSRTDDPAVAVGAGGRCD